MSYGIYNRSHAKCSPTSPESAAVDILNSRDNSDGRSGGGNDSSSIHATNPIDPLLSVEDGNNQILSSSTTSLSSNVSMTSPSGRVKHVSEGFHVAVPRSLNIVPTTNPASIYRNRHKKSSAKCVRWSPASTVVEYDDSSGVSDNIGGGDCAIVGSVSKALLSPRVPGGIILGKLGSSLSSSVSRGSAGTSNSITSSTHNRGRRHTLASLGDSMDFQKSSISSRNNSEITESSAAPSPNSSSNNLNTSNLSGLTLTPGLPIHQPGQQRSRRESFLYKPNVTDARRATNKQLTSTTGAASSIGSGSARSSVVSLPGGGNNSSAPGSSTTLGEQGINLPCPIENQIVTPYAQILACLSSLRFNYNQLLSNNTAPTPTTGGLSSRHHGSPSFTYGVSISPVIENEEESDEQAITPPISIDQFSSNQSRKNTPSCVESANSLLPAAESSSHVIAENNNKKCTKQQTSSSISVDKKLVVETLGELDWCLQELDSLQKNKSISDMTSDKFTRMLNEELSHFSESKAGNQMSEYISSTFLDKQHEYDPFVDQMFNDGNNTNNDWNNKSSNNNPSSAVVLHQKNVHLTTNNSASDSLHFDNENDKAISSEISEGGGDCSTFDRGKSVSAGESSVSSIADSLTSSSGGQQDRVVCSTAAEHLKSLSKITFLNEPPQKASYHDTTGITPAEGGGTGVKFDLFDDGDTSVGESGDIGTEFKFGIKLNCEDELEKILDETSDWNLPIFRINTITGDHVLAILGFTILHTWDIPSQFQIKDASLMNFFLLLERHYSHTVPYHNSVHAGDVLNSTNALLNSQALNDVFTPLEIMAALFAAAVHDVDHPGLTNQYLINSGSELALMYNDESVLENHHLAVAFKLAQQPNANIFENISKKQKQTLRKMVIDMVLATDMSKHMTLLADLKTMVEAKKVTGSGVLLLDVYADRIQVLQNLVHCADLSGPTKPLALYVRWCDLIMEEFFLQGDLESSQGMDVSPMCDRNNPSIEQSQIGFIDFIVHPLWETWAELVYPDAVQILETLEENRQFWIDKMSLRSSKDDEEEGFDDEVTVVDMQRGQDDSAIEPDFDATIDI